ncbi:MAG TPA: aldehyde dehydrogenase family protein [Chloroflexota bacterium]|nr:aldehyde dehydrogenase family protein [Chloroflexota bacterium]HZU07111.1 aldehyde dehydrogenase family protein [Chloroflexota bacterium]
MIAEQVKVYQNYIGGEWRDGGGGQLEIRDPANGELVYRATSSTVDDARAAIAAAKAAFERTEWADNAVARAKALYKMADALRAHLDELAELLTREGGKPLSVSRAEVLRGADALEYYAGLARNVYGRSINLGPHEMAILMREPVGVVAIIVPWNMALSLLTRSLAPALAAGNAVVIKPASLTPGATAEFMRMIDEIPEVPKGIVNYVIGPGSPVGTELVKHPDVDMVAFTGDTSTGKEIMRLAADTLKKVSLELGGKSPNIVFADADFDRAIRGAITGASLFHAGQVCVAGTRVLVQEDIHDRFMERVREITAKMRVGPGLEKGVEVGPVISQAQLERVLDYIEVGKREAELVVGGKRLTEGELAKGYFIAPTVFDRVPVDARIAQEEIFGPVISVLTFKNEQEAAEIANATVYGLAAAVWTNDINKALRVARKVRAGMVWVNTFGKLYPNAEMGGFKQSGIGRQYGLEGLWEFTELKHINIQLTDPSRVRRAPAGDGA